MKKTFVILGLCLLVAFSMPVYADDIASCAEPAGHGYYVANGLVDKDSSGWREDKITGGTAVLKKNDKGYDIVFSDSVNKEPKSATATGGHVELMSHSDNYAIFIIYYAEEGTIEVYNFFKDSTGQLLYALNTIRPNTVAIVKDSVMVGKCSAIDFTRIHDDTPATK